MQNLLFRLRRYLNYAPDTRAKVEETYVKVEETWQRMRMLSESFQLKVAAVENELRYLKTMVGALQNQLNSVHEHLRSPVPWLPSDEKLDQNPEFLLLAYLASFFQNPVAVDVGAAESGLLDVLLDAGFEVYACELDPSAAATLRERFHGKSGLHLCETAAGSKNLSLKSLVDRKEIPAAFAMLKIGAAGCETEVVRDMAQLCPEIVVTRLAQGYTPQSESETQENAQGRKLIREMRACGYRWNLLLFRAGGGPAISVALNLAAVPDASFGALFFFRDCQLFDRACRWSQGALPRLQHRT
ncbi:MAG: hypothetical protein WAK31_11925 [Chthoniobacterales bacterium]